MSDHTAQPKFLRRAAAQYVQDQGLPLSPNTLQKMATDGGGPRYHIFGNKAVYTKKDLDDWIVEKLGKGIRSTSELPPNARRKAPEAQPAVEPAVELAPTSKIPPDTRHRTVAQVSPPTSEA